MVVKMKFGALRDLQNPQFFLKLPLRLSTFKFISLYDFSSSTCAKSLIFTALNDIGLNDFLLSTAYIKEIKEIVVSRRGGGGGGGGKRPRLNMYKLCSRNRKRE